MSGTTPEEEVDALYPFDESLERREHELKLPEKLRALRDRTLAAKAYQCWKQTTNAAPRREEPRPARQPLPEYEDESEKRYP